VARKNETVEILAAVLTVIFILSLIGVLNLSKILENVAAPTQPAAPPQATFETGSGAGGMSDEETAAHSSPTIQESTPVSGTSLSPAVSYFSVEEGIQLSPGVTGLVVGELK